MAQQTEADDSINTQLNATSGSVALDSEFVDSHLFDNGEGENSKESRYSDKSTDELKELRSDLSECMHVENKQGNDECVEMIYERMMLIQEELDSRS